jgi:hypothetical protein
MFTSSILDVAAGVIFTFLAVSLMTSVIVEAIASVVKWRSATLLAGVKDLLNDQEFKGLAKALYSHSLVNPRGPGEGDPQAKPPAYIDEDAFANALLDVVGLTGMLKKDAGASTDVDAVCETFKRNSLLGSNKQITTLLEGAVRRASGDYEKVRKEIGAWFDNAMDRVSGAYKRWTQLIGFCAALILCILLNIDTLHVARTFWATPALIPHGTATQDAASAAAMLLSSFPVGWPNGFFNEQAGGPIPGFTQGHYGEWFVGCFITALATLFGASFWFDALQSVVRLKGAGPSPQEKKEQRAASA